MKVEVDTSVCIGAGQCAHVASALFDQDDDGLVLALTDDVEPGLEGTARRAEALCPSRAIRLVEERRA